MGLFQKAVETYEANQSLVGKYRNDHEVLAPIGHTITRAAFEITLDETGTFVSARKVGSKEPKILIPVTEDSSGRSSTNLSPHPLCDNLKYLSGKNKDAFSHYIEALQEWEASEDTHPFLSAILHYVRSQTILQDLESSGLLTLDKYDEKQLVCWRVLNTAEEEDACWKNQALFSAHQQHYQRQLADQEQEFCMIAGEQAPVGSNHPKGMIPINGNAKLISANDSSGFTYRGRFDEASQAATIGYIASQKAHNALRWLASEQGVRDFVGNRIFLCWTPKGIPVPKPMWRMTPQKEEPNYKPSDYREALQSTFLSFRKSRQLKGTESVVLTAFDAATTGRLSVTYYQEFTMDSFLSRMQDWDDHCCWYHGRSGIQAPDLPQIVDCAFGTQRGAKLETDDKIARQHLQRLLNCKVNGIIFPQDMVQILVQKASNPSGYEPENWKEIVFVACAAIQKYRYDTHRGGNEMDWELTKENRSFQYGRLLAVMERAELDYYQTSGEDRQTNAIKFLSGYCKRPYDIFERINRQLEQGYLNRIQAWQKKRYDRLVGEIFAILSQFPEKELNRPLENLYLIGYELQRNAFYQKKETTDTDTASELED